MTASGNTIRLTTAQAIVRYLLNQFIEIDGFDKRICGGGFGIFGHGNVPCLGEALYPFLHLLNQLFHLDHSFAHSDNDLDAGQIDPQVVHQGLDALQSFDILS